MPTISTASKQKVGPKPQSQPVKQDADAPVVASATPDNVDASTNGNGANSDTHRTVIRVLSEDRVGAIVTLVRSGKAKTSVQLAQQAAAHPAFAGEPAEGFTDRWARVALRTIREKAKESGVDLSDLTLEQSGGFRSANIDWAKMAAL